MSNGVEERDIERVMDALNEIDKLESKPRQSEPAITMEETNISPITEAKTQMAESMKSLRDLGLSDTQINEFVDKVSRPNSRRALITKIKKDIKSRNSSLPRAEINQIAENIIVDLEVINDSKEAINNAEGVVREKPITPELSKVIQVINNFHKHKNTASFTRLQNQYLNAFEDEKWIELVEEARSILGKDKWTDKLEDKMYKVPELPTPVKKEKKIPPKPTRAPPKPQQQTAPPKTPQKTPQKGKVKQTTALTPKFTSPSLFSPKKSRRLTVGAYSAQGQALDDKIQERRAQLQALRAKRKPATDTS